MVAACAFSLHARLQFIIERLRILLVCTVDNDGFAARIHDNAGIATGVGVASIAAVKSVFEDAHGEAQVAKAVHTHTINIFAGIVVVIDDVVDVRVRNSEVFPLAGFYADCVRAEVDAHAAAEQRPADEGANCNGEDRDGGSAFTRNRAWRDAAAGELVAIVAIGIAHWQDGEGEHADKKYNHGDCALGDQRAGHA